MTRRATRAAARRFAAPDSAAALAIAVAVAVAAWPADARAHQPGLSSGELTVGADGVDARVRISTADAARLVGAGPGARPALRAEDAGRAVLDGLRLRAGGEACAAERAAAVADGADGVLVTGRYRCPAAGPLEVEVALLRSLPTGHAHLTAVRVDGREEEHVSRRGGERFTVARAASGLEVRRFLALGVAHIATGWDHLAFLLGLLLLGGGLRGLAVVVTSFTVAHSATLALAALGVVAPPPGVVEPLIAASVVAVAAENLWALRGDERARAAALRRRWPLAFGFGLVHGFGFADALRGLGLARGALAAALVSFNLGVEAGQLAVVAALYPALALLRRARFAAGGARLASSAVGLAGLVWLWDRLRGG